MIYAGRVQGGDFKWTFDNSVDDAAYAVNQPLKNALVAYKGSVQSIQGEGNLPVYVPTSSSSAGKVSSSSSKNENAKSSSSSVSSSSSAKSSSSVGANEDPVEDDVLTLPIDKDLVHNFTEEATSSDYFEFFGNLSTEKGSVEYNGESLARCLKMESATLIEFILSKKATVTLVFNADFEKKVKVDGEKETANAGIVTVELAAGTHKITKGDVANLYLIVVDVDESSVESSGSLETSSSSEAGETTALVPTLNYGVHPMRYVVHDSHLEIFAENVRRLDIVSVTGHVFMNSTEVSSNVDLRGLKPGVYLVRLVAGERTYLQKIVKR